GDETIVLTLGVPTNASLDPQTVHTVTITEDDDAPTTGGFSTLYTDGFAANGSSTTVDPDISLGWSTSSVATAPGGEEFLGSDATYGFGNETATLTLSSLPPHTEAFLQFDVYVIQAWEGHGAGGGPDLWTLLADGSTALSATFSNANDAPQSYPTDYDGGSPTDNGSGRGALAHNALGYLGHVDATLYPTGSPWEDVTYRVSLALPHTADSLALDFTASGLEAAYDESWGLDNISVTVNSATTDEDTPLAVTLSAADSDSDTLEYAITGSPANGALSGAGAARTYTPSQDFNGEDTFSYTADDGVSTSAVSTVTVTVDAVNDAPDADTQFYTSLDATPITMTMSGDDVEDDGLTFSLTDGGAVAYLTTGNGGMVEAGVTQWADAVVDYSSERSASSWSAAQALGIPTTFAYGDISTSWAPSAQNDGEHWIELGFTTPVYATGAVIRETYGNGSVTQIDVSGPSTALTTVWAGTDTTVAGAPTNFRVTWTQTAFLVDAMRIYVDTDRDASAWEEIDAALLIGSSDPSGPGYTISYVPAADFSGIDSFEYVANDGQTDGPPGTVRISVAAPNTPPEATPISGETDEDDILTLTLTGSDPGEATPVRFFLWDGSAAVTSFTTGLGATVTLSDADETDDQAVATYVPPAESSGADSFAFYVTDGELQSGFETVNVTVNATNDAPSFDPLADITVDEDSDAGTIAIENVSAGGGDDEADQTVSFATTSFDTSVIPHPTVTGSGASRTLTYTPVPDAAGTVTVLVAAVDDGGLLPPDAFLAPQAFTIDVVPRNDAPEFDSPDDVTVDEDADEATVIITGVGPGGGADEADQVLTFSAVSSNTDVVPHPTITGADDTRTLTYQPAADANGAATITITVVDDGASGDGEVNTTIGTFEITVNAVNDAPTFESATALALQEDAESAELTLTGVGAGGGVDESSQVLTITASSSSQSVVPDPVITGDGDTRTVTFAPVEDAVGGALITIAAMDSGPTSSPADVNVATHSFFLILVPVNDPPEFADVDDRIVDEDVGPSTVTITGVDPGGGLDEASQEVVFSAISSDTDIVPHPSVVVDGDTATLTYTPAQDAVGTVTIALTATDSASAPPNFSTRIDEFDIAVAPLNDAPSFDTPAGLTMVEDTPVELTLTNITAGGGADEESQTVTVTATSGSPDILADAVISGAGATRTLTFTPIADAVGDATITLAASDDGPSGTSDVWSAADTFIVTVGAVNDAPTLAAVADQTVQEDSHAVTIDLGAIGQGGGDDESLQAVSVAATSADTDIVADPTVTETPEGYSLTFTPVADANGVAQITVTATDDGSADDPDINAAQQTFDLSVSAVNDPPSFDSIDDVTASEGSDPVAILITGVSTGPADEAGQDVVSFTAVSDDTTDIPHPTITGDGDTRTLTFQPEPDANGAVTITVTVVDSGESGDPHVNESTRDFAVTLIAVNDTATADATSATTPEDTPVDVTLAGSDIDVGDTLAFLLWDGQEGVTAAVSSFHGGSVSLVDAIPGDDLATATYTPAADFTGEDTFAFVVNDGTLDSATATVTVAVSPVNDAPTATAGAAVTPEDTAVDMVLAGLDIDEDVLTALLWDGVESSAGPLPTEAGGSVSVDLSVAHYIPPADFHGDDAFEFIVSDGDLESDSVTVSLTVTPVNDSPVAASTDDATAEDTSVVLTLTGSDLDGDVVTVLLWGGAGGVLTDVVSAQGGTVAIGATTDDAAAATYTPAQDFNGADSFDFVVSDGQAESAPATVTLTVSSVNDAPVASPVAAETAEDTPVDLQLTGTDVDGDILTALLWDGAPQSESMATTSGGVVVISTTSGDIATATYTPPTDFSGSDSFDFLVDDGTVASPSISVSISVTAVEDPPAPEAPSGDLTVWEEGSLDIDLSGVDVDSAALSFSLGDGSVPFPTFELATANGGAVTLADADPSDTSAIATYVPPAEFDGVDTFPFRVSDGTTESTPQDVSVTVTTLPRVSIADGSEPEGSGGSTEIAFTVSLTKAHDASVTVDYATADGEAADTVDYDGVTSATTSIPAGELTVDILVPIAPDTINEADETFTIALTGATDAVIAAASATGVIADDDDITLTIEDMTVDEGAAYADLVVSASGPTEQTVTVDFTTSAGTALPDEDYDATALTGAVVDAATGALTVQVPIVDDATNEATEAFTGAISNAMGRGVTIAATSATVTIVDDDALALTIEDTSIAEPDADVAPAHVTVALSEASAQEITVAYSTFEQTAAEGVDYTFTSGELTILAGALDGAIPVDVHGDMTNESDETFRVSVDGVIGDGVVVADGDATLTILDNDEITVSIADATTDEGPGAVASFALALSGPSEQTVTVGAATEGGSAIADVDYDTPIATVISFAPGVGSATFDVGIVDDAVHEADETFTAALSDPTGRGVSIAADSATATIQDTDTVTLSVADATATEGDDEDAPLTFDVSMSGLSEETITVDFAVAGGEVNGATEGADFAAPDPATVTFSPGSKTAEAVVTTLGDTLNEADEGLTLTLSSTSDARVTIADGEAAGVILDNDDITISIANVSEDEGDATGATLALPVSLSGASEQSITTTYTTTDGTASAGTDYTAIVDGPLTLAPGALTVDALVAAQGDATYEADETITVTLSSPAARGVTVGDGTATATIRNDDAAPILTVADATGVEGYDDIVTFTVSLSGDTEEDVTVAYTTASGTAVSPEDYVSAEGTLDLAAGSMSAPIAVTLTDDAVAESDEAFTLRLSAPTNATIDVATAAATATIVDDDHPPLTVTPPPDASEGVDVVFNAEIILPVSGVDSATLFYGEGGSAPGLASPFVQQSDTLWTATVSGESVTIRGLLWRAEVVDDAEKAFVAPDDAEAAYVPVSGAAPLSLATMAGPPNVWNAVAAPIQPDDPALSATFDAEEGGFLDEWFAWRWNAAAQRWEVAESLADDTPVATDGFEVGKGWFVAVVGDGAAETRVIAGESVDASARYPLPIHAGWNLLANPYAFPVAWSDASVEVAVGNSLGSPSELAGMVDTRLVYLDVDTQAYVARLSNEESPYAVPPGQAWWFYSTDAGELLLEAAAIDSAQPAVAAPRDTTAPAAAWTVLLAIESDVGSDRAEAAVSPLAHAPGLGVLRDVKPPRFPMSESPRLAFVDLGSEGTTPELTRSYRAAADAITWIVEVTRGSGAVLRWQAVDVPAEYELRLVDLVTDRSLDLRQQSRLRLEGGGYDSRRFALQAVRRVMPDATRLLANYPNPFNPETWIPFELDAAADVTIRIYDMRGALVRRLDLGRRGPGYYTDPDVAAHWNGRNADGEPVGSGAYFYTLDTGAFRSTRRMVILK
ncbi:hypothetical protein CMK11_21150, partial [Candidatus Poribacteria bacterium]|nr:hypothetical protein [Candidatus Poribacteria bacterium]